MAGELTIADWSADNVAKVAFVANTCVDIDASNSSNVTTAVAQAIAPVAATNEVIGVCYDEAKKDPSGNVVASSGIAVRTWGIAKITCSAAITAGQYVKVSNSSGQVGPATQTAAGSQPSPIVGRSLNTTSASGDLALVLLMIGARF